MSEEKDIPRLATTTPLSPGLTFKEFSNERYPQLNIDLPLIGVSLTGIDIIEMAPGVCGVLLGGSCVIMIASVIMAGLFSDSNDQLKLYRTPAD